MKNILRRLIRRIVNMISFVLRILRGVLKALTRSVIILFPVVMVLSIGNAILGVNINFRYYLALFLVATVVSTALSFIFNWKLIISKPTKASKKVVPTKTTKKTQKSVQRKRRKIS